jgi:diguanylate cyclase (GGDEF)-like protein
MNMPVIRLLVIDDDEVDRKSVARVVKLLGDGYELVEAHNALQGMELAADQTFDCILLDYNLPDKDGLELLAELRRRPGITAPIVMLTGTGNESVAVEALKRGAQDYLPKAYFETETLSRVIAGAVEKCRLEKKSTESLENLQRLALYDALTGLGNRNLFHIELARAIAVARRKGTSFVLLVMDLDKFKAANDTFGHEAGDTILATVGRRMRDSARATDAYFRIGGDEFTAILDAGSHGPAAAQRITTAIAEPVVFGPHELVVAVSIGIATFPADGRNVEDLVRAADAAMFSAKKSVPERMSASAAQ